MVVYLSRTYSHSQRWEGTLMTCAPFHEHVGLARPEVCASLIPLIGHSNTPFLPEKKKGNKDHQKQKKCFRLLSKRGRTQHLKTSECCRTACDGPITICVSSICKEIFAHYHHLTFLSTARLIISVPRDWQLTNDATYGRWGLTALSIRIFFFFKDKMSKCALLDHSLLKVVHHDCIILGKLNFMCCFVRLLVLFFKNTPTQPSFFSPLTSEVCSEKGGSHLQGELLCC